MSRRAVGARSKRQRLLVCLGAAAVGSGLLALGGVTTSAAALSGARAVNTPAVADVSTPAGETSTAAACTDAVHLQLGSYSVSAGMVTVHYTISGCTGTQRLHIHENLLSSPSAGSDPIHQVDYNFAIGQNSPTQQTVPLLASSEGKCWIQLDYSTVSQRRGAFIPTGDCAAPTSTSVVPSTSTSVVPSTSTSVVPSTSHGVGGTSASKPPTSTTAVPSTSHGVAGTSASQPPPQATSASQVGPVPQTGYTGTLVSGHAHPFWWASIIGAVFLLLALGAAIRLLAFSREPTR